MKYFFSNKKNTAIHSQIGLSFTSNGLSLAVVDEQGENLKEIERIEESAPLALQERLKKRVEELNLQGAFATVILSPNDYQVFLVEAPEVSESEKREALRWKVAEYIDYPIEEAVIDFIELPQKADLKAAKLIYVVVSKKSKIDRLAKWVEQTQLKIKSIDISQSALMQIAKRLIDADIGQALLYLDEEKSHLILFKDKTLYMMRELDVGFNKIKERAEKNTEEGKQIYYDLSLEIQRSLDYCASNLKNVSVSRIILIPLKEDNPEIIIHLSEALGLPVREISFTEILKVSEQNASKINSSYIAIGAALS